MALGSSPGSTGLQSDRNAAFIAYKRDTAEGQTLDQVSLEFNGGQPEVASLGLSLGCQHYPSHVKPYTPLLYILLYSAGLF